MKNIIIKINELKIDNYKRKEDIFNLNIFLDINGKKESLKKNYKLGKADEIVKNLLDFIKNDVKSKNKPEDEGDLINSIVVVRFDKDLEELEGKLNVYFKRFNELVKSFKNRGFSENYLMTYKTVDGFSQKF
jgi:hypothetical protein